MILVIVYVGAVAVLFLFVVMMLDIDFAELRSGFMRYLPIGALIGFVLLAELVLVFGHWVIAPGVSRSRRCPGCRRRARRAADQYAGARRPALHPLPVRLPDGGRDPARRDDRRDRADLARSASACAASAFPTQLGAHAAPRRSRSSRCRSAARSRSRFASPENRRWRIGLAHYLTVAAILFTLGVFGIFLNRKNVIIIMMSIELMLLAVNINFVAFSVVLNDLVGQVFAMFVLTVAAAEAAIGLAILVVYFRNRGTIQVEDIHMMRG